MKEINIKSLIKEVFDSLELNNFKTLGKPQLPMWEPPLVGIAAGDDPYYDFLKTHIGPFHWSPVEVFGLEYSKPVNAQELRVVSMAFPQVAQTKDMQKKATVFPCDNWVVSRGEWEPLMQEFSGKLVERLRREGVECVSIDLQPQFGRRTSENLGIASVWSHRHTAFAAGLGTFGLSDGLITEKGMAIRLTSLIVKAPLEVTKRPYTDHHEWCLFYRDGSCGACIRKCPVSAISVEGHSKDICAAYEDEAISRYWPEHIDKGDYIFGCGLCQAGVPCQNKRP